MTRPATSATLLNTDRWPLSVESSSRLRAASWLTTAIALIAFAAVVVKTAWLNDDAYITFRTVQNFVNGYGLTWNTAERVQAYTHPLWMFLLTPAYALTREIYFTSLALSIAVSLAAVCVFVARLCGSPRAVLLGVTCLIFSKAFVDYSTSGLENPLTHLLIVLFAVVYLRGAPGAKTLFALALLAALGALNRMDTLLIFLPPLARAFWPRRGWRAAGAALLGFLPLVLWEVFSLIYYGFPFPNTAYAKLSTHFDGLELAQAGLLYLLDSIVRDPLTLAVIVTGAAAPFLARRRDLWPLGAGIALYLIYVVVIGGDFMSGRFLAAPLLCAVILLVQFPFERRNRLWRLAFLLVAAVGLISPDASVLSRPSREFVQPEINFVIGRGVVDERRFYYRATGLLRALQPEARSRWPDHLWVTEGLEARARGPSVIASWSVGLLGYYAGPEVHLVDHWALGDPLLARLPAERNPDWRIGHFQRAIPDGYLETLRSGRNVIRDPDLAAYYDRLALITRGPLFDPARLRAIWDMNTGRYDDLIDDAMPNASH
jgi:arabinofuranosyltransferase